MAIQVTVTGTDLGCLLVDETAGDHPNGTEGAGGSGTNTGKYWTITALQSDRTSAATADYMLNLTLPHSVDPHTNAKVCKYPGGLGGDGWDCDRTSSTATTVTRNGISSLSDWAVGNNVGPTAITLKSLTARTESGSFLTLALLVVLFAALGSIALWRRVRG